MIRGFFFMISSLINFHYLTYLRVTKVLCTLSWYEVYIICIYCSIFTTRSCISTIVKRLSSSNHLGCDSERNLKIFVRIQRVHCSAHPDIFGLFQNAELARMFILMPVSISGRSKLALTCGFI